VYLISNLYAFSIQVDYPVEGQEIVYYLIQQVSNQLGIGVVDLTFKNRASYI
jgi:hypothetical protein